MMPSRPISKSLLIHSATHHFGKPSETIDGVITYPNKQSLGYIRIEPSDKILTYVSTTGENTEVRLNAEMFFDCVHSTPSSAVFAPGDLVVFNNTKYRVAGITYCYGRTSLHHLEVGLL